MIEITKLTKRFLLPDNSHLEIFDSMDFTVDSWEFIALMWQSGQGKTTFLNILAWLERDYTWRVQILWNNLQDLDDKEITSFRGKHISYIFQEYNLIESLSVEENIELVLDINHIKRRYESDDILRRVWLLEKKRSYPRELSGWEKQRTAIARSFIGETDIILADEPTGSLDEKNATQVMQLLQELWSDTQCTIIMITHSSEIAQYAQKQYILEHKKFFKK